MMALCVAPSLATVSDRASLMDLAHATNVSSWVRSRGWLADSPICAWQLVGCNEDGRVKTLSLSFNGLSGTLPPSIGDLTALEALDLEGNFLTGSVPSSLGGAALLQIGLGISNRFGGELPAAICPTLEGIVGATPQQPHLPCDLGGTNLWRCPLPCKAASTCGARCAGSGSSPGREGENGPS